RVRMASGSRIPMLASCEPTCRSGNRVPDSDRKECTQRMSWTAFTALVRRDLRLFFLDKRAMTMSFAAPIVIGSFFGYLFGSAASSGPASKIEVAVVDQDGSGVSRKIGDALAKDALIQVTPRAFEDAESSVRTGKTTIAAVIPK